MVELSIQNQKSKGSDPGLPITEKILGRAFAVAGA
jgi:hypothetical protein